MREYIHKSKIETKLNSRNNVGGREGWKFLVESNTTDSWTFIHKNLIIYFQSYFSYFFNFNWSTTITLSFISLVTTIIRATAVRFGCTNFDPPGFVILEIAVSHSLHHLLGNWSECLFDIHCTFGWNFEKRNLVLFGLKRERTKCIKKIIKYEKFKKVSNQRGLLFLLGYLVLSLPQNSLCVCHPNRTYCRSGPYWRSLGHILNSNFKGLDRARVLLNLLHPGLDIFKGIFVSDIIYDDYSVGSSEMNLTI